MECPGNRVRVDAREAGGDVGMDDITRSSGEIDFLLFHLEAFLPLVTHHKDALAPRFPNEDATDRLCWLGTVLLNLVPAALDGEAVGDVALRMRDTQMPGDINIPEGLVADEAARLLGDEFAQLR